MVFFRPTIATGVDRKNTEPQEKRKTSVYENTMIACGTEAVTQPQQSEGSIPMIFEYKRLKSAGYILFWDYRIVLLCLSAVLFVYQKKCISTTPTMKKKNAI